LDVASSLAGSSWNESQPGKVCGFQIAVGAMGSPPYYRSFCAASQLCGGDDSLRSSSEGPTPRVSIQPRQFRAGAQHAAPLRQLR
jgi:hypothetical protein